MSNYSPDLSGTHPRSESIPDIHPGMTMAEAFRAFPTAVRVDRVTGEMVPLHPTPREAARLAVERVAQGEYSNLT